MHGYKLYKFYKFLLFKQKINYKGALVYPIIKISISRFLDYPQSYLSILLKPNFCVFLDLLESLGTLKMNLSPDDFQNLSGSEVQQEESS